MLSCVTFLPRGAAKAEPDQYELSAAELEALKAKSGMDEEEQGQNIKVEGHDSEEEESDQEDPVASDATAAADNDEDMSPDTPAQAAARDAMADEFVSSLNMDAYDEEEDGANVFLGGRQLTVHSSNKEDPYITLPDEEDVESDEDEDLILTPSDVIFLMGRTEDEHSTVEVYVYDPTHGSMYVHHDFVLPSFPLSMAWFNTDPRHHDDTIGSFVAVGTFQPTIEIWNLDVLDVMEPVAYLGGREQPDPDVVNRLKAEKAAEKNKNKKKKIHEKLKKAVLGELKADSHSDGVLSLSWHPSHTNRLASGSADNTVKLWDIRTQQCQHTYTHHTDKVQSLQWNPAEPSLLLTGSYDHSVCLVDVRTPKSAIKKFTVDADIECVRWNPHSPFAFAASTETGTVTYHDARNESKPLFTLAAHNEATTSISFNAIIPSLFATSSMDKSVKLWDCATGKPSLVASKEMNIGQVMCMTFDVNSPVLLACGGNKGKVALWDISENSTVSDKYRQYMPADTPSTSTDTATAPTSTPQEETKDIPMGKNKKKKERLRTAEKRNHKEKKEIEEDD